MITLITTTRNRPLCFGFLEKWIARQTVKPDQWLVVNDSLSTKAYTYSQGQQTIWRQRKKTEGPSICENWLRAIPKVCGEKVLVAEDDDYYAPHFIETLAAALDRAELVGLSGCLYFNLRQRKAKRLLNVDNAPLAATGFRASLLPRLQGLAEAGDIFLDMGLWRGPSEARELLPNKGPDGRPLFVGMKQMPGEPGLGLGHAGDGSADPTCSKLVEWMGIADARDYINLPASAWEAASNQ